MKKNTETNQAVWLLLGVIISLFIFFPRLVLAQEQYRQAPALIHISSTISDGRYSPLEIIDIARQSGFEIVVFNEREIMRWEYGIWPLRNIFKKVVENNSIAKFGIKNYFKLIENINQKIKDVIVIPGVESTSFYFWSGSVFKNNFTLNDAHKHLLIIGLSEKALANLPITGNRFSLDENYQLKDIVSFWPLLVLLTGILLFFNLKKKKFRNTLEKEAYRNKKIFAIIMSCFGLLFCWNNYPFKTQLFDQYHGDRGVLPYQNIIDYVNKQGGMVFWAHPEAENCSKAGHVNIITKKHTQDFYNTINYTGFCVFYEGYELIGKPGGLWDKVLNEYLAGKRKKPVWAIAGLAFDFSGDLKESVKDLRNIVLLDSFSNESFMQALGSGKVYVVRGPRSENFVLEDFSVYDPVSGQSRIMGQSLKPIGRQVIVKIKGDFKVDATDNLLSIHLIKNGEIIKTFKTKGSFSIEYPDDLSDDQNKVFYRTEIISHGLHVIVNPIFIK